MICIIFCFCLITYNLEISKKISKKQILCVFPKIMKGCYRFIIFPSTSIRKKASFEAIKILLWGTGVMGIRRFLFNFGIILRWCEKYWLFLYCLSSVDKCQTEAASKSSFVGLFLFKIPLRGIGYEIVWIIFFGFK